MDDLPLYVLGVRSTALEALESAVRTGTFSSVCLVAWEDEEVTRDPPHKFIRASEIPKDADGQYLLSMTSPQYRALWLRWLEERSLTPATVVDPASTVAPSASIGPGVYLAAGVRVSSAAVLSGHTVVNYNAVIGHDAVVGQHVFVHPGAMVGGFCRIGDHAVIGANAFLHPEAIVGERAAVDALTYLRGELPDGHVATGRQGACRILRRVV